MIIKEIINVIINPQSSVEDCLPSDEVRCESRTYTRTSARVSVGRSFPRNQA